MKKNDEGFTLIELLIVIVILGILATVVVFAVGGITDRGQESACDADAKTLEVAVEAYDAQYGTAGGVPSEQDSVDNGVPACLVEQHGRRQPAKSSIQDADCGTAGHGLRDLALNRLADDSASPAEAGEALSARLRVRPSCEYLPRATPLRSPRPEHPPRVMTSLGSIRR